MARLLVTDCDSDGGVHLLDTESGRYQELHRGPVRGATRSPDGIYCVEEAGAVLRLDPAGGGAQKVAETGLNGCHDFRWLEDAFYLVACRGNYVARLDRELRITHTVQLVPDPEDVCHANCITRAGGEVLLSVFTLMEGPRSEKRHSEAWRTAGKILRLDPRTGAYQVVYEPLAQPHSLVVRGGRIYCVEAFHSRVVALAPDRRSAEVLCRLSGFVRGFAFVGDRAYAGVSRWVRKHPSLLRRWRDRLYPWYGVVEIDTATWKPVRRFRAPGRSVYDLVPLDGPE